MTGCDSSSPAKRKVGRNRSTKQKRRQPEHDAQVALFERVARHIDLIPDLSMMFAIPNGGYRHKATAVKMKAEGVRAGVPDICLPVPNKRHHGLFIEMKSKVGRASPDQKSWMQGLRDRGYLCAICRSEDDAWEVLIEYLSNRHQQHEDDKPWAELVEYCSKHRQKYTDQ